VTRYSKEEWAEKIGLLLLKAESTTPEEAEAIYAKAQEMMTKYAIDEAMIAAAAGGRVDDPITKEEFINVGIYRYPLSQLTLAVLKNNGIEVIKLRPPNWRKVGDKVYKETEILIGVGYKSDIDRVKVLQTSLMLQAMTAENKWWRENQDLYRHESRDGHYVRRQYLFSFANGVNAKLREATARGREAAEKEYDASSVALVLRDKGVMVREEFERLFPETKKSRTKYKAGDAFAAAAGHEAGRRADVGQPGVGSNRKEIDR
jgi:hypothetical protein